MRMKYLLMIVLMVTQASPVFADDSSYRGLWQWRMLAGASNGSDSYEYRYGIIAVSPEATDDYDGEPLITSWDIPTTYAAVFHHEGTDGWNGSTGFYLHDYVGPLVYGQTKTWQIYVWSTSDMPAGYDTTYLVMSRWDNIALTGDFQFQLKLVSKPDSISGGPNVGTAWNLGLLGFDISFPTYRTDNGLTGYHFEFSAMAVPEPSAVTALACGLVGVLAQTRKRRNQ